ncbi:DUF72 domain-containing protein [Paucibacter sp. APW11]|uniref:DUF72 domain-containing protein n=1 Tax=Roseateles aquae TaxID=3077235 RepID=A0ABU3P9E6_9BURK|nr:DUF72 domain-containing protein [Paucibacter sp. APW11]MDT8999196.1 DUF72 domain-containing protein [Paucibacter sp. APW11]
MQDALFPEEELPPAPRTVTAVGAERKTAAAVRPAPVDEAVKTLAQALPDQVYLGTSTWTYPGWAGRVWDRSYSDKQLSKQGLQAYAAHPLLRAVCIDRSFYRPLTASQYERYALQVPPGFRFVVKAPSLVADAQLRDEHGRGTGSNSAFLNAELAGQEFVTPVLEGLGAKAGALVFQLSPLSAAQLGDIDTVLHKLRQMLLNLPPLRPRAPDAVIAVEVRDAALLCPAFVDVLREAGATYCLGLHPKLPQPEEQLWLLRQLWPGPFVCRWNLNRLHGPYGYEDAQRRYGEYEQIVDPDPDTRALIARVARATARAGQKVYVTINNKAEGCAPLSVRALAQELLNESAPDSQGSASDARRAD